MYNREKMFELYDLHWSTHPDKKCEICGKQLWGENNTMYHDHILEKSSYPELMYEIDNLALCCPNCHANKCYETHEKLIEQAKERFGIT